MKTILALIIYILIFIHFGLENGKGFVPNLFGWIMIICAALTAIVIILIGRAMARNADDPDLDRLNEL